MRLPITVGFIGFGKMGRALAQGAVSAGVLSSSRVMGFDVEANAKRILKKYKFRLAKNLGELIKTVQLVFLCVKPQQMAEVLEKLKILLAYQKGKRPCFVSIAAGVPMQRLQLSLGFKTPVIRVMPNTPALLRTGMSAMSWAKGAQKKHKSWVKAIFSSVGETIMISERHMDAVTALSGSGPAYGFYLAESMIEAGTRLGLKKKVAETLVHQTLFGAGNMLVHTKEKANVLRQNVTSPGGTTEAAIKEFERKNLKRIVIEGIKKAAKKSKELSKK